MNDHCQSPNSNCQPSSSSVSRWSRLKDDIDSAYNKIFYGKPKFFKSYKPQNLPTNSSIHLLGVPYAMEDCAADDFYLALQNFIWLTYRSNFEPILHSGTYWKFRYELLPVTLVENKFANVESKHLRAVHDDSNARELSRCLPSLAFLLEQDVARRFDEIKEVLQTTPVFQELNLENNSQDYFFESSIASPSRQDKKSSTSQKNWFSPSEAISLLRDALKETSNRFSSKLSIYLSVDTKVVLEDLVALSDNWSKAVVVVICLRLGTKQINKIYYQKLQKMFSLQFMLGAIGGRPRAAVYLVASAENCLYSLDPHTTQPYQPLDVKLGNREEAKKWNSFHCERPSRIPLEDLDPSLAVAFMLKSSNELELWMDQLESAQIVHRHLDNQTAKCDHQKSVLFSIVKEKGAEWILQMLQDKN
uniref:Cysteine protease n=1 Tax=Ditylenchus dipsaci TaxID=166011 RepID=A0A915EWI4_9BILA